jgi:Flp pilus assembly protein TadG
MADTKHSSKHSSFLTRLLRDQAGNTIAIMAAAVVPVLGVVGGGVDMSRIYLVKTRLQAACDAGTLMGRRVMGGSAWAAHSGKAETEANKMFTANFENGAYGTTNLTKNFTESSPGVVSGNASVRVPMALMKVLGSEYKDVEVTCESELKIPATDVMFVLDTTGSMGDPVSGSGSSETKIVGLRLAASCFYETLTKENITGITAAQCGETADPQGSSSENRLRFGFVPYAQSVNVGRLLPLNYIADNWTYQSRQAIIDEDASDYVPVYGTESTPAQTNATTQNQSDFSWVGYPTNTYTAPNGTQWARRVNGSSQAQCNLISPPGYTGTAQGTMTLTGQNPTTLQYPNDTSLTRTYQRVDRYSETAFRYTFSSNRCNLQYRQQNIVDTTRTFTTVTPITWRYNTVFSHWEYKPVTMNVSALKNTATNSWNTSLQLPVGNRGANTTVNWTGCIEERKTARIMDNSPRDNWDPVPSDAQDMDIDSPPSLTDPNSQWGPALPGLLYAREKYDGSNWYYTRDTLIRYTDGTSSENNTDVDTVSGPCPAQSALYKEWTPTQFSTYLNGLNPGGNTYHDIGLLWGARLMSTTGMFSAITDDIDADVQRHMVFMTDGDTYAQPQTYAAHGLHWWDRRQNDGVSDPTQQWLIDNIDGRSQAICKWIKNKNITLWVISYGGGVNAANEANLQNCASPGKYFSAANTPALVAEFKRIAASISDLRLTE